MKKLFIILLSVSYLFINTSIVKADITNGYGRDEGRIDSVNVNDYSTNQWDRFEYNYQTESGVDYRTKLGKPTRTDVAPHNPYTENIRNNKDVTFVPPQYGVFSEEISQERTNAYIPIQNKNKFVETKEPLYVGTYEQDKNNGLAGKNTSISNSNTTNFAPTTTIKYSNNANNSSSGTIIQEREVVTEVSQYSDGSIGTLRIPSLRNLNVKVYAVESLDNMRRGVGQFAFTSQWGGNVGLAGHNSGSEGYFQGIWDLRYGEVIEYETKEGTRRYKITGKEKISDTDFSTLGWTSDNRITIITCVAGVGSQRWSIVAEQIT